MRLFFANFVQGKCIVRDIVTMQQSTEFKLLTPTRSKRKRKAPKRNVVGTSDNCDQKVAQLGLLARLSPIIPRYMDVECKMTSKTQARYIGETMQFYTCLCHLQDQHKKLVSDYEGPYNSPFDEIGFRFKATGRYLRCYRASNKRVLISAESCFNGRVRMKLFVRPYKFATNVGLSIQVASVILL